MQSKGFNVKHAKAESDYNALEEVEKFKWADFFIIQYPVYWMGTPWIMKKYIDEVFSAETTTAFMLTMAEAEVTPANATEVAV